MPEASEPYFISRLTLAGFRAYLDPKTFDFSQKRCLAVFAPNGSGKSSIVDALEFMFSDTGTLDRIGLRTINNFAGPTALEHNLAATRRIVCLIRFRGHVPKGGYDVPHVPKQQWPAPPPAVL